MIFMKISKKLVFCVGMSLLISSTTGFAKQIVQIDDKSISSSLNKQAESVSTQNKKQTAEDGEIITITAHDNLKFEGKLRLPADGKADKLIIYVNGSGPNTYDNKRSLDAETTFNYHDLFAKQITDCGGAYFSYNTRGVTLGNNPPLYADIDDKDYQTYVPSNEVQDIETIIRTLTADSRLEGTKVYLLGWSAGTIIAPQVALRKNVQVDGLLLAGYCNQTMEDILEWQQTGGSSMVNMGAWFDYDNDGKITKEEYETDKYSLTSQFGTFEQLDINQDGQLDREDFRIMMAPSREQLFNAINNGDDKWLKENYGVQLTSAWFKDYRNISPNSEVLPKLDLPIYIFQGENDANTPVQASYDAEKGQLKAGKDNLKLTVFKNHDHDLNYSEYIINKTISAGLQAIFDTISKL